MIHYKLFKFICISIRREQREVSGETVDERQAGDDTTQQRRNKRVAGVINSTLFSQKL